MREEDGCHVWAKGENYQLNKFFNTKDFSCQCKNTDCIDQKLDKDLLAKLTDLRVLINEPITITSGFRCKKHQAEVEKSGVSTVVAKFSQHELGKAVDLKPTRMPIKDLVSLAEKTFKAIGIASTWIHVDLRDEKERRWYY
jgi:uncharacterized protein YcbK (DUF882 family)